MSSRKKTVVFDLDGTLSNLDHRVHLVRDEKPNWDLFYSLCGQDDINQWCADLMDAMCDTGYHVVIVSGRRKDCTKMTKEWLEKHQVSYNKLYLLREQDDFTQDHELKKKWLEGYGKNKVLFVVDDRTRVVEMWRAEGIVCLQCYRWEEYTRTTQSNIEQHRAT